MTALTRRSFLQQAPVAAVVAAAPVSLAVAEIRPATIEDPELEIFRLARDLHLKMKAHYGGKWQFTHNQDSGAMFFVPAPPPPRIVEFAGPGWYEVEDGSPDRVEVMWLELDTRHPAHAVEGRLFRAKPKNTTLRTRFHQESWLRTIIVRKIGGAV